MRLYKNKASESSLLCENIHKHCTHVHKFDIYNAFLSHKEVLKKTTQQWIDSSGIIVLE